MLKLVISHATKNCMESYKGFSANKPTVSKQLITVYIHIGYYYQNKLQIHFSAIFMQPKLHSCYSDGPEQLKTLLSKVETQETHKYVASNLLHLKITANSSKYADRQNSYKMSFEQSQDGAYINGNVWFFWP